MFIAAIVRAKHTAGDRMLTKRLTLVDCYRRRPIKNPRNTRRSECFHERNLILAEYLLRLGGLRDNARNIT